MLLPFLHDSLLPSCLHKITFFSNLDSKNSDLEFLFLLYPLLSITQHIHVLKVKNFKTTTNSFGMFLLNTKIFFRLVPEKLKTTLICVDHIFYHQFCKYILYSSIFHTFLHFPCHISVLIFTKVVINCQTKCYKPLQWLSTIFQIESLL